MSPPATAAIIADTHMPRGRRALPARCVARITDADLLVHAGDFLTAEVLAELRRFGPPVVAVYGNVDEAALRAALPERTTFELGGACIGLIHDAGPKRGRLERMRRAFPQADAVIFGHSHIPLHERAPDGFQIFNPGSPTERRRAPTHTMGVAAASAAGAVRFRHVDL